MCRQKFHYNHDDIEYTSMKILLQVATVDKYQGQQNDYVLLSLVRTRAVGHIRDVRCVHWPTVSLWMFANAGTCQMLLPSRTDEPDGYVASR